MESWLLLEEKIACARKNDGYLKTSVWWDQLELIVYKLKNEAFHEVTSGDFQVGFRGILIYWIATDCVAESILSSISQKWKFVKSALVNYSSNNRFHIYSWMSANYIWRV